MTIKFKKAQNLVKSKKVLPITESRFRQTYAIKGISNIYTVIYNKIEDSYSCNCKNIKFTDCYHILAVKLLKETKGL